MVTQWLTPPKCNTVFTRPTVPQRESIRNSLLRPEGRISKAIVTLIESEMA